MAFCEAWIESANAIGMLACQIDEDLLRPSLTVQPSVIQTSTWAVIVALLQLQAISVSSHGEAAMAPKRQLRPQVGILASNAAACLAALAAVVSADVASTLLACAVGD